MPKDYKDVWLYKEYLDKTYEIEAMYPKSEPLAKVERYFPKLFNLWAQEAKDRKDSKARELEVSVEMDVINKEAFVEYFLHKINFEMTEMMEKC